jgi:hypothetical protein
MRCRTVSQSLYFPPMRWRVYLCGHPSILIRCTVFDCLCPLERARPGLRSAAWSRSGEELRWQICFDGRQKICTIFRMGLVSNIRDRRHNQVVHTLPTQWKPEKWYYLETSSNGLKNFLKCRTVGLCMTHNRLLNYHVVRSTKPVHFIFPIFIAARDRCMPREETHLAKYPLYPDGRRTQAALLLTLRRYDATIADGPSVFVFITYPSFH